MGDGYRIARPIKVGHLNASHWGHAIVVNEGDQRQAYYLCHSNRLSGRVPAVQLHLAEQSGVPRAQLIRPGAQVLISLADDVVNLERFLTAALVELVAPDLSARLIDDARQNGQDDSEPDRATT